MSTLSKTHRARPIGFTESFSSRVDIIIPFCGQYQKVTKLLESILRCTKTPYTLTLVDDYSPNQDYLDHLSDAKVRGLQLLRTPERLGFGGACFHGFKNTKSSWVCFVNSDCVVDDGNWLQAMGDSLLELKSQGVRMVSPLTNNSLGHPYQEISKEEFVAIGGTDNRNDLILDIKHRTEERDDPEYLSMYCFMCHRELFQRCGGFIREYPYGWYEDMEFAYRMSNRGFKQAVCRSTWIYHEGEATIRELWRRDQKSRSIMENDNFEKCRRDIAELFRS